MSKFTSKHYIAIADVLANSSDKQHIIDNLVEMFKNDNERFNEQRFRKYIRDLEGVFSG